MTKVVSEVPLTLQHFNGRSHSAFHLSIPLAIFADATRDLPWEL